MQKRFLPLLIHEHENLLFFACFAWILLFSSDLHSIFNHSFIWFYIPPKNCMLNVPNKQHFSCTEGVPSGVLSTVCRHWVMFNVGRCNDSWLISSDITFYQLCLTLRQSFILSLGSRRQHWRRQTSLCNEPKLLSWAESPFSCQHASIFF